MGGVVRGDRAEQRARGVPVPLPTGVPGLHPPPVTGAVPTAGALRVTQEPGELQAAAGDTVALACQVEVAEGGTLLRMEWPAAGAGQRQRQLRVQRDPGDPPARHRHRQRHRAPRQPRSWRTPALLWPLLGGLGGTALLLGMAVLGHRCCRRSPGAAHPDTAIYVNVVSPPAAAKPPPAQPKVCPYEAEPRWARGPPRR
ncbi:transmembrane and immunoglobulin domain-containing protein 2 isoform X4 [Passer montanus]|uniref:transmembrane and immunoglobulin domain-containing protein 2 isoform X4 n=1 Tax=Passer montanus TaxID=9160 RepID=UPI001960BA31|nr:transmembrane and immunoglobulin domain-containing protein 2 isoform X4 [Passer montanus]